MTTTPALPEPGAATVEDRVQISRRFIQQAPGELERGDRLQATEKIWGALAQMLKAHGQQRGWFNLGGHRTVGHIARQLHLEYDEIDVVSAYMAADNGHRNFYDNEMSPPEIEDIITVVADVLPELESALYEPPRPFTIRDGDLWRMRTLTGKQDLQVGDSSPTGFSNTH
ncbi:MAG: hypothetical protein OXL37_10245 [Chloroflexota bacterium]|nr:hypothetical protein [Chloroflexota bacterium]MDE2960770.1 hypothetical protein [Chloroflexota bacterium]